MLSKICCNCHEQKALTAFNRDRRRPDGRRSECRACYAKRRKIYDQKYEAKRPDRAQYWRGLSTQLNRRAYMAALQANRRAPLRGILTSEDVLAVWQRQHYACAYCGCLDCPENPISIDHLIPLAKGGRNSPINIVAACLACNTAKGDDTLITFLSKQPGQHDFFSMIA